MVKDVLFNPNVQEDKQLLNGYAVKPYSSHGRGSWVHYSSVLGTAEGAQKAGQMKMGSEDTWTIIAQFSSDYS